MNENKLIVIINKPIEEVFEFTTNPKNTHLWVPSIEEETSEEYPPKIGTQYKNRGKSSGWDFYRVVKFEKNKMFLLSGLDENYTVRYTYKKMGENQTQMEYYESVKKGKLDNPFSKEILLKLKSIIED